MKDSDLVLEIRVEKEIKISLLNRRNLELMNFEFNSPELRRAIHEMATERRLLRILALIRED